MKKKSFFMILGLEVILCTLFLVMQTLIPNWFSTATAFPFEQIGGLLRILSLSGVVGNIIAILLYVGICLVPSIVYLQLYKKKKAGKVDLLLPVLSLVLLLVIYYMINPGLFIVTVPGSSKMMLGMLFYSVFFGYLILRILDKCMKSNAEWLEKSLRILLFFVVMVFVYNIIVECLGKLFPVEEWNVSFVFNSLRSVVDALPLVLDIVIIFGGIQLLDAMKKDRYSEEAIFSAEKLAKICIYSLVITILSGIALNALQVVFRNQLNDVNLVINIPLLSILFTLAVLILAKYIRETQKMKEELDMFI